MNIPLQIVGVREQGICTLSEGNVSSRIGRGVCNMQPVVVILPLAGDCLIAMNSCQVEVTIIGRLVVLETDQMPRGWLTDHQRPTGRSEMTNKNELTLAVKIMSISIPPTMTSCSGTTAFEPIPHD